MDKQLIEYPLSGGGSILMEVEAPQHYVNPTEFVRISEALKARRGQALVGEIAVERPKVIQQAVKITEPRKGGEKAKRMVVVAQQTFEESIERIKPAAAMIVEKLRGLHETPDELSIEFGIKATLDAGIVVASAGGEANFRVTLTWKDRKKQPEKKEADGEAT
jgi:hypothetical protein